MPLCRKPLTAGVLQECYCQADDERVVFFPLSLWERARVRGYSALAARPITPALSRRERTSIPLFFRKAAQARWGGGRAAVFPALRVEDISLNIARAAQPHVPGLSEAAAQRTIVIEFGTDACAFDAVSPEGFVIHGEWKPLTTLDAPFM